MNIDDIWIGLPVTFSTGSACARVVKVDKKSGVVEVELTKDFVQPVTNVPFPKGYKSPFPAVELKTLH